MNRDFQDWDEALTKWQGNNVFAHRRTVRVIQAFSHIKPGNLKDQNAFFVTDEMIKNPSSLFRGKHELIGKTLAKILVKRGEDDE